MPARDLEGYVVGVTADRRAEEQSELLRRHGASIMPAPVLKTLALASESGLRDATEQLIALPPDVVIANTGIGIRGWLSAADAWGDGDAVRELLRGARVVARGPKAAGAAVTAGGAVEWRSSTGRLRDVVSYLEDSGVAGARIALQLDGSACEANADALRAAGADVVTLPVYRWTEPDDIGPARRLADAIAAAAVDAVTFTCAYAVDALFELANDRDLTAAFERDVLPVCIGPVCHEAAVARGLDRAVQPSRPVLGAMVGTLATALLDVRRVISTEAGDLVLQGPAVVVGDARIVLSDRERAVLRVLARRPGAVVSKQLILHEVWGDADGDGHALEVTVGRLRRRLGAAGSSIRTVVRRGYQLV